jgi:hypothetical protein
MTIEKRSNSYAIICDCPNCHIELIRGTEDDVLKEAHDEGWSMVLPTHEHKCKDCVDGNCPGEAVAKSRFGQSSHTVITDKDVQIGDMITKDGMPVGTAKSSAKAGDPVEASLVMKPFEVEGEDGMKRKATFFQKVGATIPGIVEEVDRKPIAKKAKDMPLLERKEPEIDHESIAEVDELFEDFEVLIGDSNGDPGKFN